MNLLTRLAGLFVAVFVVSSLGSISVVAQTWDRQDSPVFTHFSSVHFITANTGWACGNAGRILKTINKGATWFQVGSVGVDLADIQFIDENTGWATGLGGVIFKTSNGGSTWLLQSIGTTGWLNCVFMWNSQIGWAGGLYGTVLVTTNGGANWIPQASGTASTIANICFTSVMNGWLSTDDGKILRTSNGGISWSLQLVNPPTVLNAICFVNASLGWVAGGSGRICKTTDGGATWSDATSGTTQQLNSMTFVNADSGWVAGNGGTVLMTTNGGVSWASQISTTTENLQSINFVNGDAGHAVGLNNIIIEYAVNHSVPIQLASFTATLMSGTSVRVNWSTISEINNYGFEVERAIGSPAGFATISSNIIPGHGTTNEPQIYAFTDANAVAGRLYYRLKQMDLDGRVHYTDPVSVDVLTGIGESKPPAEFSLEQNYPNPFNPTTKIEYSIAKTGFVSLSVYDVLGREVATIVNDQLTQGRYTKTFVADGLSSGVYYYKLTSGNFSETKKLILSK